MVLEGYVAREEEHWDRTRNIMAFIATFGGMGSKEVVDPGKIMRLGKDRIAVIKPIRTYTGAMELLREISG